MNRIKLAVSKNATVVNVPTTVDPAVPPAMPDARARRMARRGRLDLEHLPMVPPPLAIAPYVPPPPPPPAPAPRQPLGSAEAAAWRSVAFVLSKTASRSTQKIMAERVEGLIQGTGAPTLGLALEEAATLFHPEDPNAAAAVLGDMRQACEAGALSSNGRFLFLSQLATWPEIPAAAADSPLRFWLPFLPEAAAPALELVPKAEAQPTTWKALVAFRKASPGHSWTPELKAIVAKERKRLGDQPGAAATMAKQLGLSVARVNELARTAGTPGKRQVLQSLRTGTK